MDAKEYLNRYKELDDSINSLCDELAHWRAIATKVTPPEKFEGGRAAAPSDKISQAVAAIIDLENQINAEIDKLVEMRKDIQKTISEVDDARLHRLLSLRYISFKKWEDIAEACKRDVRTVYIWHSQALKKVEKILKLH